VSRFPISVFAVVLAVSSVGCLSSSPRAVRAWTVEPVTAGAVRVQNGVRFDVTRLASVTALPPYDGDAIRVRRADGTLPADPLNRFAASSDRVFRRPVLAALERDGRFGHVVAPNSSAAAAASVEVRLCEVVLDASGPARTARVALAVDVLDGRTRAILLTGSGSGTADAAGGDYTAAFTAAADVALAAALGDLK